MGRVFFPTYRANIIGVRDVGPYRQLGSMDGLDGSIVIPRAPSEPYPRAANNPTGRMLGVLPSAILARTVLPPYWGGPVGIRTVQYPGSGPVGPIYGGTGVITLPPGAPLPSTPPTGTYFLPPWIYRAPPPVSSQTTPTPVVSMPPASPAPGAVLVSSGGGTAAPSTAPITIQTGDTTTSAITAWLQGSTPIFNFNVPNAVLVFAGVVAFAWLSGGSGKKR